MLRAANAPALQGRSCICEADDAFTINLHYNKNICICNWILRIGGAVSPKEFKKFKEAAEKLDREHNTPKRLTSFSSRLATWTRTVK